MQIFNKDHVLSCIYCDASQESPAIDFIPYLPHSKTQYQTSINSQECIECNHVFFLKLMENEQIGVANLPCKFK